MHQMQHCTANTHADDANEGQEWLGITVGTEVRESILSIKRMIPFCRLLEVKGNNRKSPILGQQNLCGSKVYALGKL